MSDKAHNPIVRDSKILRPEWLVGHDHQRYVEALHVTDRTPPLPVYVEVPSPASQPVQHFALGELQEHSGLSYEQIQNCSNHSCQPMDRLVDGILIYHCFRAIVCRLIS